MQSETQIDYIAEAIEETFGERCPDYSDGCPTCEAWKRFDYLESLAALSTDAEPVAWMDDGDTRNGSTSNSFRVVTAETKAAMPRASADNFNTPLYAAPTTPLMAVKALQMADETFRDLGWHDKYEATTAALAALSAQVQDVAAKSLADAYQKYLDSVNLYNERHAIMKTKALGTMRVDEEYKAIDEARRVFDKLAVDIAKSALPAAPAKQEGGKSNPVHNQSVENGESGEE